MTGGRRIGRWAAALVVSLAGLAGAVAGTGSVASAVTTASTVIAADFPDPSFVREGQYWYAFATNGMRGNVQVARSTDFRTWASRPDALPQLPSWAASGQTWAPTVARIGSTWTLFYSARHLSTGFHCIGRATATSIEGPYQDPASQPFLCQMDRRGSIDPSVFQGSDGSVHLLYKSEGIAGREPTRLWSHRLTPAGDDVVGRAVEIAATDQTWEEPIIEGPRMVEIGGQLWLLYAGNHWESSSYAIGVARCSGPQGPCTKWGAGPLLATGGDIVGPGSPDVVTGPDGSSMLTFHAWDPTRPVGYANGGRRIVRATRVRLDGARLVLGDDPAPRPDGYRFVATDGGIFSFGRSSFEGSTGDIRLAKPIVDMAAPERPEGYWLVASDGGIFAFGDVPFAGSQGARPLNRPIVAIAATPTGRGYWLVASDGGIFSHGDARFFGSTGAIPLNRPIVDMAVTPTGRGYWLVASDGGIFAFGDAAFHGSTGAMTLNAPIVSMIPTPWGDGYRLVASDGGVFSFGAAGFFGSTGHLRLNSPIVSGTSTPSGQGYWFVGADGGIFSFGDAPFHGSTGDIRLNAPIVGMSR